MASALVRALGWEEEDDINPAAQHSRPSIEPDMPDALPTVSPLAVLVLMLMLTSIVGAWIWAILRLAFGYPVLPPNTPRIVPWGAGSVLVAVLTWVALQVAVPTVYFSAFRHHPPALPGTPRPELTPGEMMALSAIQNTLVLALIPLVLAATSGARLRDFGIGRGDLLRQIPRGIVAYPLLAPLVFGVMMASVLCWGKTNHPLENAIVQDKSPGMVAILVLAGVVLAPLAEELIFRGVLLGWLTRLAVGEKRVVASSSTMDPIEGPIVPPGDGRHLLETVETDTSGAAPEGTFPETAEHLAAMSYEAAFSPLVPKYKMVSADPARRVGPLWLANIGVSLIFAALHGAVWPTPVPIFFLSLGLGLLYQRTGGIVAPTALHMTFNGVSTLLMFLTLGTPPPKVAPKAPAPIPPPAKAAFMLGTPGRIFSDSPIDARLRF